MPEQVVRARFTAMAIGDMDFFRESIIKRHQHLLDAQDVLSGTRRLAFHSVQTLSVKLTGLLKRRAVVLSRQTRSKHGCLATHTERVSMRKESGAWRVENIDVNPPGKSDHQPARNAPCPCGSGLKYKRCCGAEHHVAQ